jgi:hypothetical protein
MRRTSKRLPAAIPAALALLLVLPVVAAAQSAKPTVTTGAASVVTPTTVTLTGAVDPNGARTTYLFQYGTSTLYGSATAIQSAGDGTARVPVSVPVASLTSATTYHYRLVARNRNGPVEGADRTFRTATIPLGATLLATPNPVLFGQPTVLGGALTGTGSGGRSVVLQANPFPYTQGFAPLGNPQITTATGAFAFPLLSVPLNTQYRIVVPSRPEVSSPIVGVAVAVRVTTHTSTTRVSRGQRVRFSGSIRPARDGAQVAFQKRRNGRWVNVAGTVTRHGGPTWSRYSKRVRIRRGGLYRVFASIIDGNYASNVGRTVRIHSRR